ncbi:MAG: hypothetical protein IJI49_01795 [Bacilli bacterium]|nr:hypothetical protein [Bacilli bacterium]
MCNIDFNEVYFKYEAALKLLQTKFEIISNELNKGNDYNCIEYIKSRIKTKESICNKLKKHNYELNDENIKNIHDIAGIRIICSFLNDIDKIEQLIIEDEDIIIKRRKDYISNPKKSGYSSLHLNVEVPVKLLDKTEYVEVEIQIRTIAMDMWASLEHKLFYKNNSIISELTEESIKNFSIIIKKIDIIMKDQITESNKYNIEEQNELKYLKETSVIEQVPMLKYELARKIIKEKIENINYELSITNGISPIEHIKTRIKEPNNIVKKLKKLNYDITIDNMKNHIHDLVGIRIVCSFLSDLEEIKSILEKDDTIEIIKRKNYIENPKENGYRSYHLNALVPVKMINSVEKVEVEIQIRTIAMDMWATLEHKICYRRAGNIPESTKKRLRLISNIVSEIDKTIDSSINDNKEIDNKVVKKLELIPKKNM